MKYVLLIMTLSGTPKEYKAFNDSTEAAAYKTLLFDYNRRKAGPALRKHGWSIPTDWKTYNEQAKIVRK